MNGHNNTSLQRIITIRTPENLEINYSLAGAGTRAAAYLIDLLVMLLGVYLSINFIMAIVAPILTSPRTGGYQWYAAISGMITFTAFNSYFIFFEWLMNGQTPGKRLVGIRVIKQGGYSLSFLDTLLRNLMRFVDFLPALYGFGLISLFLSPRCQRLGDLVASTLVVHQQQVQTESLLPEIPKAEGSASLFPADQVGAIPRQILEGCVEFFRIMPDLAGKHRQEIASELLDLVRRTSGLNPPRTQSAEGFLAAVIHQSGQIAGESLPAFAETPPPA